MTTATREPILTAAGADDAGGGGSAARTALVAAGILAAAAAVGVVALSRGNPDLALPEVLDVLAGGGERLDRFRVLEIRLPRYVLALLAGAALGAAGTLLQDALRNALAGPELLGVSSGAAVVVAGIVVLGVAVPFAAVPLLALAGALASGLVVVAAVRRSGDPVRVILVGAALSGLLSATVVSLIALGGENEVDLIYQYLLGSLSARTWEHVRIAAPYVVVGVPLALAADRTLNLMQLGDEVAAGLGLRVQRARVALLVLAATLVAAVVAICGPVPWVALFAPRLARLLLGTSDAPVCLPYEVLVDPQPTEADPADAGWERAR